MEFIVGHRQRDVSACGLVGSHISHDLHLKIAPSKI